MRKLSKEHPEPDVGMKAKKRRAPGATVESRENQIIALTMDLAEKQILEGTASSQVITHFLKAGSTSERLVKERIAHENELLKVKAEQIRSQKRSEELFANALKAMASYTGQSDEGVPND